jgi:hypothetical protein
MNTHADQRTVISKTVKGRVSSGAASRNTNARPLTNNGRNESRDDGDQRLQSPKRSTSQTELGAIQRKRMSGAHRPPNGRPPPKPRHRKDAASLEKHRFELLQAERQRLTEKLKGLEAQFEAIQKKKAYEHSSFLMKRGHLLVEIEGLRDDEFFLIKKRDKRGEKLLEMHMKRLELLEGASDEI